MHSTNQFHGAVINTLFPGALVTIVWAAATWQWCGVMDAALQGRHSISQPLVVAAVSRPAATGGAVSTPASAPSAGGARGKRSGEKSRGEGKGRPQHEQSHGPLCLRK